MKTAHMSIIIAAAFIVAFAQEPPSDMPNCMSNGVFERIESLKAQKLARELELDESEFAKLFPVLNEFRLEREALSKKQQLVLEELRIVLDENADTIQLLMLIEKLAALRDDETRCERKFYTKLDQMLDAHQLAKFLIFDAEFKRRMVDAAREMRHDRFGRCPLPFDNQLLDKPKH